MAACTIVYSDTSPRERLVGRVVRASASRAEDPTFDSGLRCGDFAGSSHTGDLTTGNWHSSGQAPGVIGSTPGLAGTVSV